MTSAGAVPLIGTATGSGTRAQGVPRTSTRCDVRTMATTAKMGPVQTSEATPTQERDAPFKDSATSETTQPTGSPNILDEKSADSVIIATEEPIPRIQLDPVSTQLKDPEVIDFGWNAPPDRVPAPLLKGLSNDDLYTLLRRFNKQIFHVKAIKEPPSVGSLDLEISQDEEYSPDKLRATLERLYMTVIVGLAAFGKHIARLRSWNEPRRTAGFCAAYYVAWLLNFLLPLFIGTAIILILEPSARSYLFPPAPLAMISATTGNIQQPKAGELGSKDSLSGAPEAHKGEAVEQEARHFVSGFATMAVSTAAGKGPGEDGNGNAIGGAKDAAEGLDKNTSSVDNSVPDPVAMVTGATEAKDLASGDVASQDPAKQPVESAMWSKARPIMRILADVADGWERFGNALSPSPPFPTYMPRLRLAAPLVPLLLAQYISIVIFVRATTFLLGFLFFGQPLITRAVTWLSHRHPDWRQYLELRRTLLIGVPTNAQLTLELLRRAEAEKAPLPPPPTSADAPTAISEESDADSELTFDTTSYSVDTDHESLPSTVDDEYDRLSNGSDGKPSGSKSKPKAGKKIAGFLKSTVRAGIGGALNVDAIKAAAGSETSKRRIGAVSDPPLTQTAELIPAEVEKIKEGEAPEDTKPGPIENGEGPTMFTARMRGKKGHVLLITSAMSPCVSFVVHNTKSSLVSFISGGSQSKMDVDPANLDPQFTIALNEIVALRKVGGFGWKGRIVVGWAMGREILDGLEITDKQGKKIVLTAIRGRDELFNRLIAVGGQLWECW